MGEWQPGRGTWNRIARVPASGKLGEAVAEWMFAEVNGVGPQALFQQEASQR